MKISRVFSVFFSASAVLSLTVFGQTAPAPSQEAYCSAFAEKFAAAEKQNATALAGSDGWLFLAAECRLLSVGRFWGEDAGKVSRSPKPEAADPIPAIVHFQQQLKERGIELLLVPVPPKAAIYPGKLLPGLDANKGDPAAELTRFYDELRAKGVDVLDLTEVFRKNRADERGPVFCKTDTHWSGVGCMLAGKAIAEKIRTKIPPASPKRYDENWEEIRIEGDLPTLLPTGTPKPEAEKIEIRKVTEKGGDQAVTPDANSPVLVLGDSHTLVFHEFLGTQSGLIDQLTAELHQAPDLIGIRGSGSTQVRKDLYRRSVREAGWLAKKKIVIWCFTAREFTEADQGWQKLPVAK